MKKPAFMNRAMTIVIKCHKPPSASHSPFGNCHLSSSPRTKLTAFSLSSTSFLRSRFVPEVPRDWDAFINSSLTTRNRRIVIRKFGFSRALPFISSSSDELDSLLSPPSLSQPSKVSIVLFLDRNPMNCSQILNSGRSGSLDSCLKKKRGRISRKCVTYFGVLKHILTWCNCYGAVLSAHQGTTIYLKVYHQLPSVSFASSNHLNIRWNGVWITREGERVKNRCRSGLTGQVGKEGYCVTVCYFRIW